MPEIYGNTWSETARDKLVARLNTLKTTMATGYDPTFSYVYEKHNTAYLLLNSVSVDMDNATATPAGANQYAARWILEFSIRVHTAYADGIQDGQKQARLLNSIAEGLKENLDLEDGYRIDSIGAVTNRQLFEESDTFGGSLNCMVVVDAQYTQP